MAHFETPNLDALNYVELDEVVRQAKFVMRYAETKIHAMAYREIGQIPYAQAHELTCERLYNDAPAEWRW